VAEARPFSATSDDYAQALSITSQAVGVKAKCAPAAQIEGAFHCGSVRLPSRVHHGGKPAVIGMS
jgi:hypothetical protein